MSVTRYDVVPWDRYRVDALPKDGGAWVRYDDHVAEVGQWAATVGRVTRERDDEHLARAKAEARVQELEADPRMALTYDDLARFAAITRSESLSIYDAAAMRWRRLIAARDAALAAVSAGENQP